MNTILTMLTRSWRATTSPVSAASSALASPVHVLDPEARVRLDDGLLTIERQGEPPVRLRLPDVSSVSLHGRAAITTPSIHALLEEGIPVVWRSQSGYYLGQTHDLSRRTARIRRAQYAAHDTPLALAVAQRLVAAKLRNMRALLRRRGVDDAEVAKAALGLAESARRARKADNLDLLRGLEGAAAAAYFACWPVLLKRAAADLGFPGRQRRPPAGPVNALLSYCYAVLTGHCGTAALAAGLDPTEGCLHATRAGRPALALDLLEPFRPTVADSAALFALNTGEITSADFTGDAANTQLSEAGRKKAIAALERRLDECFTEGGRGISYRDAIDRLAHSVAQAFVAGSAERLAVPERP